MEEMRLAEKSLCAMQPRVPGRPQQGVRPSDLGGGPRLPSQGQSLLGTSSLRG